MKRTRMRSLLQLAAKVGELPLSNRDRVKSRIRWHQTKWGRKDDWEQK